MVDCSDTSFIIFFATVNKKLVTLNPLPIATAPTHQVLSLIGLHQTNGTICLIYFEAQKRKINF